MLKRPALDDTKFRNLVAQNTDIFAMKVKVLSCQYERDRVSPPPPRSFSWPASTADRGRVQNKNDVPVAQSVITLINKATNKLNLAKLPEAWCAAF